MNSIPCVLVLSHTATKPKSLIKLITKTSPIENRSSGIVKKNWSIDSKYYTADISFLGIESAFDVVEDFSNVEGVIINFDSNKETGLKNLQIWDHILNSCDPEVKILVASYCNEETKITKSKALEWCLKKGFELVELYSFHDDSEDSEPDFKEKVGVERIIEALHSHPWSNLVMKPQNKQPSKVYKNKSDTNNELEAEGFSESSLDDFTELFSQLHTMRESLNSLPTNQRKQCAEQMVSAFWKAIGGDEEELTDL